MTAVATMAGQIGTASWNTSTTAQASAMKMAAKMYFSISRSTTDLVDPRREIGDLVRQRDTQSDEDSDRHREHAERDPEERVLARGAQQRLVRGFAGGREHVGRLDVPLDLRSQRVTEAHQLEVTASHGVLPLE